MQDSINIFHFYKKEGWEVYICVLLAYAKLSLPRYKKPLTTNAGPTGEGKRMPGAQEREGDFSLNTPYIVLF